MYALTIWQPWADAIAFGGAADRATGPKGTLKRTSI
jgi:hypothetical protein